MTDILTGIVKSLDTLYPDIPIYREKVPQDFSPPCFYVKPIEARYQKGLDKRYWETNDVCVYYFASTNKEAEKMGVMLFEGLRYIKSPLLKGAQIGYEVEDATLRFYATYRSTLIYKGEAASKMRTLETKQKGDEKDG